VSERGTLSDKTRRWRGGSVRKRGSIGQNEMVERRKCPIEGLYRTKRDGREEEMSDRRALSDKRRRLRGGSVRKRGSIGQKEKVEGRKCPKEGLYRTKRDGREEEMSDRRALSDKRRWLRGGSVRKRGSIGQKELKNRRKCPIERSYWTKQLKTKSVQ
jgi:hypothetical protein